nr:reverse transcriptase domain-containing protein [Tanacetum cinerariifolium]
MKELVLVNKDNQQASVKAVEETFVTCGGLHSYYDCLATGGNTFDSCAATRTYNQGGNGYQPQGDPNYHACNQMGPPGFPPLNVQNNQNYNRYNQNQGNYQASNNQGRGQNFNQGNNNYQALNFQAPNYQAQVGPLNELTNYMKRSLPSNIVANPRGDLKAITTRSGVAYDGPTVPPTLSPLPNEVERETKATKDKKLSLPDLTPTCMTLELATRSFAYPAGITEDVFMQVGKITFPSDFVVIDYDVDPRVPLIMIND